MQNSKIRVRVPLPDKEQLLSNSRYFASCHNRTVKDELNFYIRCRLKDIEEQTVGIEKSKKRIERHKKCIKIAEDIMSELNKSVENKQIKRHPNKYTL